MPTLNNLNTSTYKQILTTIHNKWSSGAPFALRDVANAAGVSSSSVVRVLALLQRMKFIAHTKRGFAGRYYRVTPAWPAGAAEVIESYEYAKLLKL